MKAIQATLEAAERQEGEEVQESLVQQALLRSCSHPALVAGGSSLTLGPCIDSLLYVNKGTTPVLTQASAMFWTPALSRSTHTYLYGLAFFKVTECQGNR